MITPKRIHLRRTKGWCMPENTVKVDRSTAFGNPFAVTKAKSTSCGVTKPVWIVGSWNGPAMWIRDSEAEARQISVDAYRAWVLLPQNEKILWHAKRSLRGKDLACWCKPGEPCHADVLLELSNIDAPAPVGDAGREAGE